MISAVHMARPYSNDLRGKIVAAHAAGKGSQGALAEMFGVSVGWVEKVFRQQRQTGQTDRVEQRHGPQSRVDAACKVFLLEAIAERPDLTLVEVQKLLLERRGVRLCIGQVFNVLKQMKVRLKKSRSTPPNGTPK